MTVGVKAWRGGCACEEEQANPNPQVRGKWMRRGKEDTQAGTPWAARPLRSCKQFAFSLCGISGH